MPIDIYHSQYTKDRHGEKTTVDYTRTHSDVNGKDINSETRTETAHYKGDEDGCR